MRLDYLLCIIALSLICANAFSATYWVSPTGNSSWENCKNDSPLNGTQACSIVTANANANAGDTINIRGGTYYYNGTFNATIIPGYPPYPTNRTGTSGNPITYTNYLNEEVIFDGNNALYSTGLELSGVNYIRVNGIHFKDYQYIFEIKNSSYNEITNCVFEHPTAKVPSIESNSTHNKISNCTFLKAGTTTKGICEDNGDLLLIGLGALDESSYNTIENSVFYHSGHASLAVYSNHNVIRNNFMHNEGWLDCSWCNYQTDKCGNRNIGTLYEAGHTNLFENNILSFAGIATDGEVGSGLELATSNNIVRYNKIYANSGAGIMTYDKSSTGPGWRVKANNNYIYFNTIYKNGDVNFLFYGKPDRGGIWFSINTANNIAKNNILYQNKYGGITCFGSCQNNTNENNWDQNGDPMFVNPAIGDPFNQALPDLKLQNNSPCINKGTFLTTITSNTGNGTTIIVADANYFTDGWGIIEGDTIQLEGQATTAKILNINYQAKTIILDKTVFWVQGQGISLAYSGSAPEIGAYEFEENTPPQNICSTYPAERYTPTEIQAEIQKWTRGENTLPELIRKIKLYKYCV
jgi:hypothetical protein